jgi:hypothetical protein
VGLLIAVRYSRRRHRHRLVFAGAVSFDAASDEVAGDDDDDGSEWPKKVYEVNRGDLEDG